MATEAHTTRHLPASHARHLAQLKSSARGFLELDGRSLQWVEELAELGFVACNIKPSKRGMKITVELSDRGRYALELDARGVDPYLVMT